MPIMAGPVTHSSGVDLSRLPAPSIVPLLSYETILAQNVAQLQTLLPEFDAIVESDPVVKVLEAFAYRELLLRQTVNDAGLQMLVAYSTGSNLDHLALLVGVVRLVLVPADIESGTDDVLESDESLRQRIVLAPEGFSVAGPELAYVYHAKSSAGDVLDATATSPAPGEVLVSVLSRIGDGSASPELLATVDQVVNSRSVRPLGDHVTVASANVVNFSLRAILYTYAGPDSALVLEAAGAQLDAYLARSRLLGRDITLSSLHAALTVEGVQRVVLESPLADVVCAETDAAWCIEILITHGGNAA